MTAFEYRIRQASVEELALLPAIEREAGRRFQQLDYLDDVPEDLTPKDELLHACDHGHVWVAVTPPERVIGFAYGTAFEASFHLEEVDVLPEHGRRGVGTALIRTVVGYAQEAGFPAVTLTTFRHVPWNAPFYARLGFRVVPPSVLTPELAAAFRDEARRGLPIELRVVMRLDLESPE